MRRWAWVGLWGKRPLGCEREWDIVGGPGPAKSGVWFVKKYGLGVGLASE